MSTSHKKKRKKKKGKGSSALLTILLIVSMAIFGFAAFNLAKILLEYKAGTDEYKSIEARFTTVNTNAGSTEESVTASGEDRPEVVKPGSTAAPKEPKDPEPPLTINWEQLAAVNSDIVGWIYVEEFGDTISYPVLRGPDNDYYLRRTFEKKDVFAGSIFENYENARDFADPHTILYGHNMKNGSMFAKIKRFSDPSVLAHDPYFWILTPDGNYRYHIFSIFTTDENSDVYTMFSGWGDNFTDWVKTQKARSAVETDAVLGDNEFIVTLSTCTNASGPLRTVVLGKCDTIAKPQRNEAERAEDAERLKED